jgi:hypothetical protein
LLRRPSLIDDFTFLYMWIPVAGFVGWFGWSLYRKRMKRGGDGGMPL